MKLKPIVASMFMLGLVSGGVAFAAVTTTATTTVSNTSTQTQVDAMQAKIAKMDDVLSQNQGGTGLSPSANWFNSISVSGLLNVDAIASNRTVGNATSIKNPSPVYSRYNNGDASDLTLSNANLFVDAQVNDWTKAHLSLNYQEDRGFNNINSLVLKPEKAANLDEGYLTFANFSQSPMFAKVGKQYLPFGDYDVYAMVPTLTQLLTETNQTAAVVGMVDPSGFNGAAYILRGASRDNQGYSDDNTKTRLENFGLNLGFAASNDNAGYKVDVGYLNNMADVDYVNAGIGGNIVANGEAGTDLHLGQYAHRVGALSAMIGGNMGPFDASLNYVTALRKFDLSDVGYDINNSQANSAKGAKPWAAAANVGYSFDFAAHQSRIGLSYQQSGQASNVGTLIPSNLLNEGMPRNRYQVDYKVNVSPNTNVGVAVYHDRDYSVPNDGTGNSSMTGVVRLGVKFA